MYTVLGNNHFHVPFSFGLEGPTYSTRRGRQQESENEINTHLAARCYDSVTTGKVMSARVVWEEAFVNDTDIVGEIGDTDIVVSNLLQ